MKEGGWREKKLMVVVGWWVAVQFIWLSLT